MATLCLAYTLPSHAPRALSLVAVMKILGFVQSLWDCAEIEIVDTFNRSVAFPPKSVLDMGGQTATISSKPLSSPIDFALTVGHGLSRNKISFSTQATALDADEVLRKIKQPWVEKRKPLRMVAFRHVQGCTVCKDMYPHYRTPDGQVRCTVLYPFMHWHM
jgi:hypothetical protein